MQHNSSNSSLDNCAGGVPACPGYEAIFALNLHIQTINHR